MEYFPEDIDADILESLTLSELRIACQTNRYFSQFCRTNPRLVQKINTMNQKVDRVMDFIQHRKLMLQPYNNIPYKLYHQMMHSLNMIDLVLTDPLYIEDFGSDKDYDDAVDDLTVYNINVVNNGYSIEIIYYFSDEYQAGDLTTYRATPSQFREFMKRLIYDDLIFSF
jgi:hypothetical protein